MREAFLRGTKTYLRPIEEADIADPYLGWLNDREVTRYLETGRFPSTPSTLRRYLEGFAGSGTNIILAICDVKTDRHVGNVTLHRINWVHRTADTGIMIGAKEYWGMGYGYEAWSLVLDYAFNRLGLRKVIAGCVAANIASLELQKKLGFKIEGTFRKEVYVDGKFDDLIRLGLFKEEFYSK